MDNNVKFGATACGLQNVIGLLNLLDIGYDCSCQNDSDNQIVVQN